MKVILLVISLVLSIVGIAVLGFVKTCQAWSELLGDNYNDRSL